MKKVLIFVVLIVFFAAVYAQVSDYFYTIIVATELNLKTGSTLDIDGVVEGTASFRGTNSFTTTAAADTVVISGVDANSIFVVSGKYTAGVDQQDVLQWEAKTDTLIVHRLASGENNLAYSYIRID